MPNRFTRVPDQPVPDLHGLASALLPVADLFMVLMLSRPPSGTLRTTWVTPATLRLCWAQVAAGALLGAVVGGRGAAAGAWLEAGAGLLLLLLAIGAAAVATVGVAQRQAQGS